MWCCSCYPCHCSLLPIMVFSFQNYTTDRKLVLHANAWFQSRRLLTTAGTEPHICGRQYTPLRQARYRRARAAIVESGETRGAFRCWFRSLRTGEEERLCAHGGIASIASAAVLSVLVGRGSGDRCGMDHDVDTQHGGSLAEDVC